MDNKVLVFGSFTQDEIDEFESPTQPNGHAASSKRDKDALQAMAALQVEGADSTSAGIADARRLQVSATVPVQAVRNKTRQAENAAPKEAAPPRAISVPDSKDVFAAADGSGGKPSLKSWVSLVKNESEQGRRLSFDGAPSKAFLPRGLVNCGNTCFVNSTLQALLSCSPFWNLLQALRSHTLSQDEYPFLHAFASFAGEFEAPDTKDTINNKIGKPVTPTMFDPILQNFNPNQPANRQEDAQEFLGFLMNHMHDELVKLEGRDATRGATTEEDDAWQTVGPKNRTAFTRTYSVKESSLFEIFGGQQQSVVKAKGVKPSATVEPFYLLHLDIASETVRSVEDALKFYAAPESLEGYKSATGKAEGAYRSLKLRSLPKVLILHLMRFSYGAKGSGKLHKHVSIPVNLTLGRELLASTSESSRRYDLVATITHYGKSPSGGHYTAATKQQDGKWFRFDDRLVKAVTWRNVVELDEPYILFYRRLP